MDVMRISETHEEEKGSDARLESRDGVARLPVQPTDKHAKQHRYYNVR
jgi:hypothetical protein